MGRPGRPGRPGRTKRPVVTDSEKETVLQKLTRLLRLSKKTDGKSKSNERDT